jgi:hypothetical protein
VGYQSGEGRDSHIQRSSHWELTVVQANPEYLAVNWEASGGGAFAVIPVNEKGRLPEQIPLFRGHTAPVLDTDWWVRELGGRIELTSTGTLLMTES